MDGSSPRVVLYGHAGCPGTARARAYLRAHGIGFEERDVANPAAAAELRSRGAWATPLLVVGGHLRMVGFDEREFGALLARAGEAAGGGA